MLSAGKSLPSKRLFERDELLVKMPGLNPDGLVGGASYYDAQVRYPERLVVENVRDAVASGAVLETYTHVTRVRVERGNATGVDWQSARGSGGARAPLIVNAAGPWVDEVLGPELPRMADYVRSLREGTVRGRPVDALLADGDARSAVVREVRAWASAFQAPTIDKDERLLIKLRAFLTLIGIIIGVAAVVVVGASISGLKTYVVETASKVLGSNHFMINRMASMGRMADEEFERRNRRNKDITWEEYEYVRDNCAVR